MVKENEQQEKQQQLKKTKVTTNQANVSPCVGRSFFSYFYIEK